MSRRLDFLPACEHDEIKYWNAARVARCVSCGEMVPLWVVVERLMKSRKVVAQHGHGVCPYLGAMELVDGQEGRVTIIRRQ